MSETVPSKGLPAAGWYEDPGATGQLRWWSGASWTEHLAPPVMETPIATSSIGREPRVEQTFVPPGATRSDPASQPPNAFEARPSANTLPVWLIASVIAAALGVHSAAVAQHVEPPTIVAAGISIGILAALLGLVVWDHAVLESRGLKAASVWWVLLLPPLVYLVMRRAAMKKLGIRANAPSNVYVLTAVAAALLTGLTLGPVEDAKLDSASIQNLEQQASAELQKASATSWTVSCPADAAVSTVGTSFVCTGTDVTGQVMQFTARVVSPRRFEVGDVHQ